MGDMSFTEHFSLYFWQNDATIKLAIFRIVFLVGCVKMRRVMLAVVIHTNDNSKEH